MKAFPMTHPSENTRFIDAGMDLRDYFAAKAMQGFLASDLNAPVKEFAFKSYVMADAMMEARKQ